MQVLADFVSARRFLQQRLGFITGERDGLIAFQRTRLAVVVFVVNVASARRCVRGHTKSGKGGEFRVASALVSVNYDAPFLEQLTEQPRSKLGRILDGEGFFGPRVIERQASP